MKTCGYSESRTSPLSVFVPSWREGITHTADPFSRLIELDDSASKNKVLWVWPVQKSYENVSAND